MANTVIGEFPAHSFPDKTVNIDRWDSVTPWWLSSRPYSAKSADSFVGQLVSEQPTTVEHWAIQGVGVQKPVSAFDQGMFVMVRI